MVSLADVAKSAGVSIATASLALRGRGQVAAKTVERIRLAAEELGYKPNPLLASLATRRFRSHGSVEGTPLAILEFPRLPGMEHRSGSERYPSEIIPHARNLGYAPYTFRLANSASAAPIFREFYHRMVQGIILVGSLDMKQFGADMPWEHFSVVACARFAATVPFHTVRPNIFQSIKLAFENLRTHGYRRIGFALGQHATPMEDDVARHGTAIALENRFAQKKDRIPPFSGAINDHEGFISWVKKNRPEAVVAFHKGHYHHLVDAGFKIPGEMGFACLHLDSADPEIQMSGLFQNRNEIARQSVLQLDQLIRNRERGIPILPLHILVPSVWNEGRTLIQREEAGSAIKHPLPPKSRQKLR